MGHRTVGPADPAEGGRRAPCAASARYAARSAPAARRLCHAHRRPRACLPFRPTRCPGGPPAVKLGSIAGQETIVVRVQQIPLLALGAAHLGEVQHLHFNLLRCRRAAAGLRRGRQHGQQQQQEHRQPAGHVAARRPLAWHCRRGAEGRREAKPASRRCLSLPGRGDGPGPGGGGAGGAAVQPPPLRK